MISSKKRYARKDLLGWVFLGISVLMLGKSLALCVSNDIWYDELFTVGMIEHSYGELIAFTARDVHPPLYYCVTKFIVDLCKLINPAVSTVAAAKAVSVLPYFILLLYSLTFIRGRFGWFPAGMFAFCVTAMPQLPAYTVEIRMYSWALLFVTASLLHAYGTITAGRERVKARRLHGAALVLYGLAAAYTQYFACVAVVMIYLYVLVVFLSRDRGRIMEWCLWTAVSAAGYLPWIPSLIRQMTAVHENYWILPLTWRSLGGCVKFLLKPAFANDRLNTVLAVVLFGAYVGVFAAYVMRYAAGRRARTVQPAERQPAGAEAAQTNDMGTDRLASEMMGFVIACIASLGGLVLFGFAASMLLRPIFVYRYMIPAMGGFWLAFALCLDGMLPPHGKVQSGGTLQPDEGLQFTGQSKDSGSRLTGGRFTGLAGAAIVILTAVIGLRDYRAFMGEEEYKILLMQDTKEALALIQPDDIMICNFDQVQAVTSYYIEDTVESYLWGGTPETLIQEIIRPYDTAEETEDILALAQRAGAEGVNLWFLGSFNSREEIVAGWREAGLTVEEQGSFLLERYWFNLYTVSGKVLTASE